MDIEFYLKELIKLQDQCLPMFQNLLDMYRAGRVFTGRNTYNLGEWVREEATVYINDEHCAASPYGGCNWDEWGSPTGYLWGTLVEEAAHAWFDTDAAHGSAETNDFREQVNQHCGKHEMRDLG